MTDSISAMDRINIHHMIKKISGDVHAMAASAEWDNEDLQRNASSMIEDCLMKIQLNSNVTFDIGETELVTQFTVKANRRGCVVVGLNANGKEVTATQLRGLRKSKRIGASMLHSIHMDYVIYPLQTATRLHLKTVLTRG